MSAKPVTIYNFRNELESDLRSLSASSLLSKIDLAEHGDTRELFALYRDLIAADNQVQLEFENRKRAVLGDTSTLMPYDKDNEADVFSKDRCFPILDGAPFAAAMSWLLNATLYPVAVAEKVYTPTPNGYELTQIIPVPFQLLDFRSGRLRIFDTDANGTALQTSHEPDAERYMIHRGHTLPLPDQWGGPMRSILFWILLRSMSRQWWADLLERYGNPFLKGKYSDAKGKDVLERAFRLAQKLGGIVIHKNTEVEIVQAASGDSSNAHERFVDLCSKEISKLIAGQTLSSNAQPTGLGNGATPLQGDVRDDIRKADGRMLATTLRTQLLSQFCRINGITGRPPLIIFGSDSAREMAAVISTVQALGAAGLEPDDDALPALAERIGYGIRRKVSGAVMPPFPGLSAVPLSAAPAAPKLEEILAKNDEKIRAIILSSDTRSECLRRLSDFLEYNDVEASSELVAEAMDQYSLKGLGLPKK